MSAKHFKDKANAYWKGKTSVQDEKWLKDAAATEANETDKEAAYFQYLKNQGDIKSNRKFEAPSAPSKQPDYMMQIWQYVAAACFVLSLSFTVYFSLQNTHQQQELYASRQLEAQYAYDTTKEVLILISGKINAGADETRALGKLNAVQQLFDDKADN